MSVECQEGSAKVVPEVIEVPEVPIYDVLNPEGKGPLMIACDHGGNTLPESMDGLVSSPEQMELHIAYDIGVRQVASILSKMFDAAALIANYSRLLVDLNRYPGDPDQIPSVSGGHRIVGNECITQQEIDFRLEKYFYPYHDHHATMVANLKSTFCKPIILSIHSFTEDLYDVLRPWHFGVLWEKDRELAHNLLAGFRSRGERENPHLVIGDNQPYHASTPQGYSIVEHAAHQGVEMALLEIRQDLLLDSAGQAWAAGIIFEVVKPLLDDRRLGETA